MGAEVVAARRQALLPPAGLRLASDQRLVEHVHAGSERAFEVLFDRHHRPVLAFCRRMLGSREEAEDVVQQTFLAAYREVMRAEQPLELRPWLYAIARHRCLSALRARRARSLQEVPEQSADHLIADVTTREDLRAILADVSGLPDDQRAALVLAELGDVSHAEIARILECPRERVKALVFQARASLTAGRAARETSCAEIQEQLRTLRGGALRRTVLRRHLRECPSCRAFRETVRIRRRQLGLLLPVAPMIGLKRAVLGALFGSGGGGAGGAALTAGALSGAGLAATALVIVAIPAGIVAASTASRDGHEQARPAALADTGGQRAAPPMASTRRAAAEPPGSEGGSASAHVRNAIRLREPPAPARPNGDDKRPAAPEQAGGRDQAERTNGRDHGDPARPQNSATPSEPPKADRRLGPVAPAKPLRPPRANGHGTPARPPKANGRDTPARPPKANGHGTPARPPKANGHDTPAKPPSANGHDTPAKPQANPQDTRPTPDGHARTPPIAAPGQAPVPGPSAEPSRGGGDAAFGNENGGRASITKARGATAR